VRLRVQRAEQTDNTQLTNVLREKVGANDTESQPLPQSDRHGVGPGAIRRRGLPAVHAIGGGTARFVAAIGGADATIAAKRPAGSGGDADSGIRAIRADRRRAGRHRASTKPGDAAAGDCDVRRCRPGQRANPVESEAQGRHCAEAIAEAPPWQT